LEIDEIVIPQNVTIPTFNIPKKLAMEQHIFAFSLIIEGTTEKLLQFKTPLKPIYNKALAL
jgi:hypothetical protein